MTADGPKDTSFGGTRAGAGSVLFCLQLLQTLLECAWTPGSPLRDTPSKRKVGSGGSRESNTYFGALKKKSLILERKNTLFKICKSAIMFLKLA